MAVIEIRCPRCGSVSHMKNEKTDEYCCDHCGTTFRFLDTTKKEVITDIRRHNCPTCGRPVKDEGYICTLCGTEDLCENCVQEFGEKIVCNECIKREGWSCDLCSTQSKVTCVVCGAKRCEDHADDFDIETTLHTKLGNNLPIYKSLRCKKCGSASTLLVAFVRIVMK